MTIPSGFEEFLTACFGFLAGYITRKLKQVLKDKNGG